MGEIDRKESLVLGEMMARKDENTLKGFNYDTYCGLYCGACSILTAYRTGRKDRFASYWTESTLKASLQLRGIDPDGESLQLRCHGCKTDTLFANCRHCKIRACAVERRIEHCNECSEYPCGLFHESLFNAEVQKLLPHLKEIPDNLMRIGTDGVEQWLSDQEKRWKCPGCCTAYSWYATTYPHCGNDLS